jgi:hypothetical protein
MVIISLQKRLEDRTCAGLLDRTHLGILAGCVDGGGIEDALRGKLGGVWRVVVAQARREADDQVALNHFTTAGHKTAMELQLFFIL